MEACRISFSTKEHGIVFGILGLLVIMNIRLNTMHSDVGELLKEDLVVPHHEAQS